MFKGLWNWSWSRNAKKMNVSEVEKGNANQNGSFSEKARHRSEGLRVEGDESVTWNKGVFRPLQNCTYFRSIRERSCNVLLINN